jgi:predicted NUDIX family NTP pyrophosphohydrolase
VAASSTLARMAKRSNVSAGLLLFRRFGGELEVFLAHPGGPFWRGRDLGAWTVPKGLAEEGEEPLVAAIREFEEETAVSPEGPPAAGQRPPEGR